MPEEPVLILEEIDSHDALRHVGHLRHTLEKG